MITIDRDEIRRRGPLIGCCLAAALLILATLWLPLWTMTLKAPQYPDGLYLRAYGSYVDGDLREINIINHYVGMEAIDRVPAPEMALFPYAIWSLVILSLAAPLSLVANRLAIAGTILVPVATLADLQWWLHRFGQNLDPKAPLRFIEPFTPLAIGISKIGNFESSAMVSYGFFAWGLAALLLYFGTKQWRDLRGGQHRFAPAAATIRQTTAAIAATALAAAGAATTLASPGARAPLPATLQSRIDAAAPGALIVVGPGTYEGPLRIRGPLRLVGRGNPVIVGDGAGSVVEVSGDGVTIRGLTLRRSGRHTSAEAAGIKATGSRHRFAGNRIEDVYFGVHLADGGDNEVSDNVIEPGSRGGVRPGHAISLWYQRDVRVTGNRVARARDGVYLSFADDVVVERNVVRGSRYAVHSMYSKRTSLVANHLEGNLVGAALMYSEGLTMRCNRVARHREGATAYGVLLKDIGDLLLEGNLLVGNRVGIYGDNTPLGAGRQAIVRSNALVGNETALALQSTVRLTFSGNRLAGNLLTVRTEGGDLSSENRWAIDGRGNSWDDYTGFDADGDGIGDLEYRYEAVMDDLVRRFPLARAFLFTPAHLAIEHAARAFPLYRPAPLIVDPYPLMTAPDAGCWEETR